jgi:hypothetical protein
MANSVLLESSTNTTTETQLDEEDKKLFKLLVAMYERIGEPVSKLIERYPVVARRCGYGGA